MLRLLFFTFLSIISLEGNSQNVGIGTTNPGYKFQVNNSPLLDTTFVGITNKTTGANLGDGLLLGVTGKSAIVANLENSNLRLGTNNQTRIAIDSVGNVGIGSFIPGFPKYKLDVEGDINSTGLIRLNGDPGTVGQVLGSNGTASPKWVNSAFGNTVRFFVKTQQTSGASTALSLGGVLSNVTTYYNLDPTAVIIGSNTITINKSGLYHFEGSVRGFLNYNAAVTPGLPPQVLFAGYFDTFNGDGMPVFFSYYEAMRKDKTNPRTYYHSGFFSQDVHIIAPKIIQLGSSISAVDGATNSVVQEGTFSGYLMSE